MTHARLLLVDPLAFAFVDHFERYDQDLQRAGLRIEAVGAESFAMAIRLLQEGSFDLIITHYTLDGGYGNTLISRVRHGEFRRDELGTSPNVPAIGTTGLGSPHSEILRAGGCNIVLTQPRPSDIVRETFAILKLKPPRLEGGRYVTSEE